MRTHTRTRIAVGPGLRGPGLARGGEQAVAEGRGRALPAAPRVDGAAVTEAL
ncbi:MAG: hypothetical protein HZT41_08680 [Dechloromonas sp.]|nr:MAG: hypothetical protein HZT41_08680 [Dechloromonas sp.]